MDWLRGGGQMGELIRRTDWSKTPVGPIHSWPQSLRTAVSVCVHSRFPILIWWGPELVMLYNDAYRPILGAKHPRALGQRGSECWSEIWPIIGPMLEGVLKWGEATWSDDQLLLLERNGYPEECYFTFSYSPILDETGGVGGVFTAVTETTERVVGERRMRTLRDLAARSLGARRVEEACRFAGETLATNPQDIPFALLYLLDEPTARLAYAAGLKPGTAASLLTVDLGEPAASSAWPLAQVARTGQAQRVEGVAERFGSLPGGSPLPEQPWGAAPNTALVLPVTLPGHQAPALLLVLGVSPRRVFDEAYRNFFDLVAGQTASALADALAYQEERKRAEALAELDRAKTAFFSNVSHEFRTPLTLMLGPLEDVLAHDPDLARREELEVVRRNGLRLLKLVNTLLDFARIEAGRIQAVYQPTDLAGFTAELASVFRSAIERAGLRLEVDCPPLPEPIYVDPEMWEKIVLNLLSNALKFTFEGGIRVSLRPRDGDIELQVSDTGTGIPQEELPRIFERFHRVKGAQARTHEGTGIGLALVQELVRLHGGSITVESEMGRGSTFTVRLPTGSAHLPLERIGIERSAASTALGADPFLEEALRWFPEELSAKSIGPTGELPAARILLADDNADMREYVRRILGQHWAVEAVPDGRAALEAARERPPDLVLADVMMPGLDGFELLRELRADPHTRAIPVILLSGRAGEESRIEGLQAGADDYLVKPFSARELLARVSARLELSRLRAKLDQERAALVDLFSQSPVPVAVLRGPDLIYELANPAYLEVVGRDILGKPLLEALPELKGQGFDELLRGVMRSGVSYVGHEALLRLERRRGEPEDTYWTFVYAPLHNEQGEIDGVIAICNEVTEQVRARQKLEAVSAQLRTFLDASPAGVALLDPELRCLHVNRKLAELNRRPREDFVGRGVRELLPDAAEELEPLLRRVLETGEPVLEQEFTGKGRYAGRTWLGSYYPVPGADGGVAGVGILVQEITERKQAEERLRASEVKFATAFNTSPVVLSLTRLSDGRFVEINESFVRMSGYTREEVLGRTPEELGLWAHPEQRRAGLERLRSGERARDAEAEFIAKDGTLRTCLLAADLIPLEGEPHIMTVLIDITERKRAEEASGLAAIVTSSTDAIVSKTLEGIVTSWNASAERIFGYTAEEMIGQPILRIIPPERHHEEQMILSRIKAGERIEHYETVRRTKDGRYLDISLSVSPVRDRTGRIIGASKIARDITDRKWAEAALRESEERYRELSEAQKRFVNDAAHELRAPLTSIQGNLEILQRFRRMKRVHQEEAVDEAVREAQRLARLVNDMLMLALARGDAGAQLRLEPVRLDRVLEAAFATARALGEGRHLERGDLPEVSLKGDADRLKQLALILLENALSYTPEGAGCGWT